MPVPDWLQEIFRQADEARAEGERIQARYEAYKAKHAKPQDGLVFKTLSQPVQNPSTVHRSLPSAVSDTTDADVTDDDLTPFERGLAETIGAVVGGEREYFHGYIDDQVSKLREEIGQLRADYEILRNVVSGKRDESNR